MQVIDSDKSIVVHKTSRFEVKHVLLCPHLFDGPSELTDIQTLYLPGVGPTLIRFGDEYRSASLNTHTRSQ